MFLSLGGHQDKEAPDRDSSDKDSDTEEVSTLVKGRLAFVDEEVRKLREAEAAMGHREEDVEVGWRHNLDTLDSLLPLLESMVEDLDKLEGRCLQHCRSLSAFHATLLTLGHLW